MKHTVDQNAGWEKLVALQPAPSREHFDELFAGGDREAIILATLPLIRSANRNTPANIRDDVEQFVLLEITREVDRLLQHPNANAGSYLIDVIKHAITKAKFGTQTEARECVSTNRRIYRPRPKASDAERDTLVRKLELQGCSPQMIDAELVAAGFDRSRIVCNETEWPMVPHEETDIQVPADFGACDPSTGDWDTLIELHEAGVLTEEEMQLIDAKMQGFTNAECASIFAANVSTIVARVARIKTKVHNHENNERL